MATIMNCPLDGLPLAGMDMLPRGNVSGVRVGEHVHLESGTVVACLNNHSWKIMAFLLERVT